MIEPNACTSDAFKQPNDSKMVNVCRINWAREGFSNVRLRTQVIDLIRLYSPDRPSDRLVLEELEGDRLNPLREHTMSTPAITTKHLITQTQKVLGKVMSILPSAARD